jgi:hypothetical protein
LQGKEVLTSLLGVLGTIVGFYFGISQDQVKGFDFDPIVISKEAGEPVTVTTAVHGGKAPYFFEFLFTPATIPAVKDKSLDGNLKAVIGGNLKQDTEVSFVLSVTDSEGKTGSLDHKKTFSLKAAKAADEKKK